MLLYVVTPPSGLRFLCSHPVMTKVQSCWSWSVSTPVSTYGVARDNAQVLTPYVTVDEYVPVATTVGTAAIEAVLAANNEIPRTMAPDTSLILLPIRPRFAFNDDTNETHRRSIADPKTTQQSRQRTAEKGV